MNRRDTRMSAVRRGPLAAATVAFVLAACGRSAALSPSPAVPTTAAPTQSATPGLASPSIELIPSPSAGQVPPGTIAFVRGGTDGADHYFTIRTDGSNEHELFSNKGCECIRWSPDGAQIWTLAETDVGTLRFVTMDADGSNRVVHVPSSETLNLAGGPASSDGQQIAFFGWDSDPDSSGLYIGSPDLSQLTLVLALPDGLTALDPLAFAPDGSAVLFWGQRGSDGVVDHAGDLFMVDADGTNLRQLNSDDFVVGEVRGLPATLSPDGGRVAFAAFEPGSDGARSAIFVVPVNGGEAERITDISSGLWVAVWAPVGERIASWRWWTNDQTALSLVNADGTDTRQLTEGADEVGQGGWSPTGDYLIVARGPDGQRDLWIMDLEGRFVAQVTHKPSGYGMYSWQPGSNP